MTVSSSIDLTTRHGQRAAERLRTEEVAWLTTVDPAGMPQPTPVWFLWLPAVGDDAGTGPGIGEILVVSRPATAKLRNVRARPQATLHFNTDSTGDDVVVLLGRALVDDGGLGADLIAAFDAKYAAAIRRLGTTPEQFHEDYRVLLRIVPERLRGW